jgi:hypothetical protein
MGRRALSIEEKRARARERIRKRRVRQHLEHRRQQSAQQCSHNFALCLVDNTNNTPSVAGSMTVPDPDDVVPHHHCPWLYLLFLFLFSFLSHPSAHMIDDLF